jgi:hypothetical protein
MLKQDIIKLLDDPEFKERRDQLPNQQYEIDKTLAPKILEAFRDFEMAAYNNSLHNNLSPIKHVLMDKISKCITLAEEIYYNYMNKIKELFGKETDDEIFDKKPEDSFFPTDRIRNIILSRTHDLFEIFTNRNYIGIAVEDYWQLYTFDDYDGGELTFLNIGKFKTIDKYIKLKEDLYFMICGRAKVRIYDKKYNVIM